MAYPYPGVLTPGQERVVKLIADGLTYDEIGARLNLSQGGVLTHTRRAAERLGLDGVNRGALVNEAWWAGGVGDRPELLAEIERLTEENDKLRSEPELARLRRFEMSILRAIDGAPSDHRTP